ncbi:helix-turn-helix domain-containing protein [Paenibacillus solisilvae]|uniref:Helix-turn-helix domain-containing protein n=1 Tax=Paenibacillus solisilvae TaxID=2486751 RepID=A0ABW0W3C7_9BACL
MNRTWLRKMIWSYLPIFFIMFSFVFFLFFQTLVEQNNHNTKESSQVFARQLLQSVDVSLKSVDYLILRELMYNKVITDFFDEKDEGNVYLNYQVINRLLKLKQEAPIIDSYYLVRYNDGIVFNGDIIKSMDDFEDVSFIRSIQNASEKSPWTALRTYREYAFQHKKEVVSLVHKVPLSVGSEGLFVVNVSVSSLQDLVEDMYDSSTGFVQLYDRSGQSLFKQNEADKKKEVLASFKSDYTGWEVESGVNNGRIVNVVSSLSSVWPILGFVIFIAGVGSIIYVTRKNYKPLEDLVLRINDYVTPGKQTLGRLAVDEFTFIESAINNFAEQSKIFKKESEEAFLLKKRTFFTDLIASEKSSIASADPSILPAHSKLKVLIIEIDHPEQSFNQHKSKDQSLFKFVISSATHELFSQLATQVWLEWISPLQLTGIHFQENADSPADNTVYESIVAWVHKNLAFTVTIGVGESVDSLEGATESYKQAVESLKFKASLGNNRIIRYEEARNVTETSKETNKHLKVIHSLVQSFRLHEENWTDHFHSLFAGIRQCCLSKSEITGLIRYFLAHMDLQLSQASKDYYEAWTVTALPPAKQITEDFDTLDELEASFFRILESYSRQLNQLQEGRHYHQLMRDIREYIEEHYANSELSLEFLSDKFDINAKYLSQLFKEEFGENFLDFLADLRIQHAKRWLVEQSDSIQDVGERVGYANAATFRRVFRRVEGISPVDYRKRNVI